MSLRFLDIIKLVPNVIDSLYMECVYACIACKMASISMMTLRLISCHVQHLLQFNGC